MNQIDPTITISIPIKPASFKLTSSRLKKLEAFTKFVFCMIADGHTQQEIQHVTMLQEHLVLEEIHRLIEWGLLDEYAILTPIGTSYKNLIDVIDYFNAQQLTYYIDLFGGKVLANCPLLKEKEQGTKLKSKVTWVQTTNPNYNDADVVFRKHHLFTCSKANQLSKEEISSLEVHLDITNEKTYFFIKQYASLEDLHYTREKDANTDIVFQMNIPSIAVTFSHQQLIYHNAVLSTLEQLQIYDQQLLSEKSLQLLALQQYYKEELKPQERVYHWLPFEQQFQLGAINEKISDKHLFKIQAMYMPPSERLINTQFNGLQHNFFATTVLEECAPYIVYASSDQLLEEFE